MKNWLLLGLGLGISTSLACLPVPASVTPQLAEVPEKGEPLVPAAGNFKPAQLGIDEKLWLPASAGGDREALLRSIDHSLAYLSTTEAVKDYAEYPIPEISRTRVIKSLKRFRQLLYIASSATEFQQAVQQEFSFYQSVGRDGKGTVGFTGYFEPTYAASPVPTPEYRYPIYRKPADLDQWSLPHPTRTQLEGADGLRSDQGPLRGLELAWLSDRLEAFLIQVQGSARLQMTDGTTMTVGYAGRTEYPYISIGRELVNDRVFSLEELTLPKLLQHFQQNPAALDQYLPRNQRFVFFRETDGAPATGSLSVPVTTHRSIATDKTLMPPGALALIQLDLPQQRPDQQWTTHPVSRYVLDQDTGGAIRGAGRVDIFMGTGPQAGKQAGLTNSVGQLYYLLLKK